MQQYNVGVPIERIVIDIAGPFPECDRGKISWSPCITSRSRPKYTPSQNQEASTVADALVTHFFCRFRVPIELHATRAAIPIQVDAGLGATGGEHN